MEEGKLGAVEDAVDGVRLGVHVGDRERVSLGREAGLVHEARAKVVRVVRKFEARFVSVGVERKGVLAPVDDAAGDLVAAQLLRVDGRVGERYVRLLALGEGAKLGLDLDPRVGPRVPGEVKLDLALVSERNLARHALAYENLPEVAHVLSGRRDQRPGFGTVTG